MNIALRLSSLVRARGAHFKNTQFFYIFLSVLTILYITQSYRIFLKNPDLLYFLRVTEDYALIFIFLSIMLFSRHIKFKALLPFAALFLYSGFYYLISLDMEFIRSFVIIMLWFITSINIITYLKPNHLFYILSFIGLISSLSLLFNVEQTLALYIAGESRLHAEGEGILLNINNIALILVAIVTASTVLLKNIPKVRYGTFINFSLYISVATVLLIVSTRSATIFFLLSALYALFTGSIKKLSILLLLISIPIFILFASYVTLDELKILDRFLNEGIRTSERYLTMMSSVNVFMSEPIFGITNASLYSLQMRELGSTDHNFYTTLLGSNGLLGFFFVIAFYNSITTKFSNNINGFLLLKGFFFYTLIFAPAGHGIILMAVLIYYLSELRQTENYIQAPDIQDTLKPIKV